MLLAVWSCKPPASRRDIGERLAEKGWKPATVLNFLYRLEAKGWVKSGKDQNRNIYTPTITKRAYSVWIMRERLDAVFGGDVAAAVRALVSESGCGQSELEQAIAQGIRQKPLSHHLTEHPSDANRNMNQIGG